MMTVAHLEVVARTTPELLERVCRVLRHRGATLEHLLLTTTADAPCTTDAGSDTASAGCADPAERTRINLRARIHGDPDLMVRQLDRLPDVDLVRRQDGASS